MNFDAPVIDMAEARDYLARKRLRDKIEREREEKQREKAIRARKADTEDGTRDGV
jgi:hypothetical protein